VKRHIVMLIIGLLALLLIVVPGANGAPPSQDTTRRIEELALRIHLHNARSGDLTYWAGGVLGTNTDLTPTWPLGEPLYDWEFPGLGDGQSRIKLDDLTRPTLINIWAAWCPPCVQEFPLLTQIALAPDQHAYDVIFVDAFDEDAAALQFLSGQRQGIRVVSDPDGTLANMVGALGIPTSILIDANHNVIAIQIGNFTSVQAALFEILARDPSAYTGRFDPTGRPEPEHFVEVTPVTVYDGPVINYGDSIEGTVNDEQFQQVTAFEGRAGDVVTARMDARESIQYDPSIAYAPQWSTGRDLEPYIVLLTPGGEYLAESRDFLYEPFAQVKDITLPEDGTYFIVATRYMGEDGISAGDYTLTLTR
jgi:thiol-disulfide isomerase/thioredoxin